MYPNLAVLVFGAIFFFIFALFLVGLLIFQGLGLYKMAKNARLHHPWTSFLYSLYNMSLLAQRSLYFHTGKKRNLARWSIWMLIITIILSLIMGLSVSFFMAQMLGTSYNHPYYYRYFDNSNYFAYYGYGPTVVTSSVTNLVFIFLVTFPIILIALGGAIFNAYVLYYIYKDYSPGNEWVMLLISILLGVWPIIFLVVRNVVPVSVAGYYPYGQPKYGRVISPVYCGDKPIHSSCSTSLNNDSNKGDAP